MLPALLAGLRRLGGEDADGFAALHLRSCESTGCGTGGQGLEKRAGGHGEAVRGEGEGLLVEQPLVADGGEGDAIDRPGKPSADVDRARLGGEVSGKEHGAAV